MCTYSVRCCCNSICALVSPCIHKPSSSSRRDSVGGAPGPENISEIQQIHTLNGNSQKFWEINIPPKTLHNFTVAAFEPLSYQKLACKQGRRHGFLSGGRIVGSVANLPQNTLKIGKKHRILATSFSNLGGRPTRFSKVRGSGPPPPVGDAPACKRMCGNKPRPNIWLGGTYVPPIGFSQIAEKWRRCAPPNLA